jgi:arginine-tRNA-protein transferase
MFMIPDLKVYATQPHSCSYLEEREATTLFIDPDKAINKALYSHLADLGFRRSGQHIYRPHCQQCNACIPARVPALGFIPNRQQRKVWNRNQDLTVTCSSSIASDEHYELYARYISQRHSDGDMYPPDRGEYESFLCSPSAFCRYYEFRKDSKLLAVAVCDVMNQGLAAIYTFYCPEAIKRSLGVYAVLWQIEEVKRLGLRALYLGYWIKECQKMRYKRNYRPLELLINGRWIALN